jgi:hypothetical protein
MINLAIQTLRPTSSFTLFEDDYNTLIWQDPDTQPPTLEEVNAQLAQLKIEHETNAYIAKRQAEYPSFIDYLDGVVKGDQAQIDKYIADCQAVKTKYPKPS